MWESRFWRFPSARGRPRERNGELLLRAERFPRPSTARHFHSAFHASAATALCLQGWSAAGFGGLIRRRLGTGVAFPGRSAISCHRNLPRSSHRLNKPSRCSRTITAAHAPKLGYRYNSFLLLPPGRLVMIDCLPIHVQCARYSEFDHPRAQCIGHSPGRFLLGKRGQTGARSIIHHVDQTPSRPALLQPIFKTPSICTNSPKCARRARRCR